MRKISINKLIYFIPIIWMLYLIYRLINISQITTNFPLGYDNDLASYIAYIFFLINCGFNNLCGYWYNGFFPFYHYSPAYFLLTLPIFYLTKNILLSAYISIIFLFVISFTLTFKLAKNEGLSNSKKLLLFSLVFANPFIISSYIKSGRLPEFLGLISILMVLIISLKYFDKRLDKKFFFMFIPTYVLLILSHQQMTLLGHLLILGFLIIKNSKDKIKIILASFLGLILSSFWLVNYIKYNLIEGNLNTLKPIGLQFLIFTKEYLIKNIIITLTTLFLLVSFIIYYSQYKNKKLLLFFSPILILNILVLLRINPFIPFFNQIAPNTYMIFLILFASFFFVKINFDLLRDHLKLSIILFLIILPFLGIIISHLETPYYREYTKTELSSLELLKKIDDKFIVLNGYYPTSYPPAYHSYAPIYLNLTTPQGFNPNSANIEHLYKLQRLDKAVREQNCSEFNLDANELHIKYFLAYDDVCEFLPTCNVILIEQKDNVCLLKSV